MRIIHKGVGRQAFSYMISGDINWYHLSGKKSNHIDRLILTEENQSNYLLLKLELKSGSFSSNQVSPYMENTNSRYMIKWKASFMPPPALCWLSGMERWGSLPQDRVRVITLTTPGTEAEHTDSGENWEHLDVCGSPKITGSASDPQERKAMLSLGSRSCNTSYWPASYCARLSWREREPRGLIFMGLSRYIWGSCQQWPDMHGLDHSCTLELHRCHSYGLKGQIQHLPLNANYCTITELLDLAYNLTPTRLS